MNTLNTKTSIFMLY